MLRFGSGLLSRSDILLSLSGFREGSQLNVNEDISTQMYERWEDEVRILVK
jgi:hypothetical protein